MHTILLAQALNPANLFAAMPGGVAQGLIWGVMALGVYITFRILDIADMTVDGSFTTGVSSTYYYYIIIHFYHNFLFS